MVMPKVKFWQVICSYSSLACPWSSIVFLFTWIRFNPSFKLLLCNFQTQWKVNDGKCGICGDPWNGKRENEAPGGKYATGTIVATYISGQHIDVEIKVTTNHKGWFEFKLCENNNIHQDKDQSCFDK